MAPHIIWRPDPTVPRKGRMQIHDVTTGFTFHWGDGFAQAAQPSDILTRTLPVAGAYTAVVVRQGESTPYVSLPYKVVDETEPNVTVEAPAGTSNTARVTWHDADTEGPVTRYRITWERSSPSEDYIAVAGGYAEHRYSAGTHPVQVHDMWTGHRKVYQVVIGDPVIDPAFTVVKDPSDATGRTALLEVTAVPSAAAGAKLTVTWDDGAIEEIDAVVGTKSSHAYTFDGDYLVVAEYTADESKVHGVLITIPFATE